jgi:hypothetical protein
MPQTGFYRPTPAEMAAVAAKAKAHYEQTIQPRLRPEDHGRYLAIDSETGDFEIGDDPFVTRALRARANHKGIFLMRVGYKAVDRLPRMRVLTQE